MVARNSLLRCVVSTCMKNLTIQLEAAQIQLLDEALRIAYSRLVDAGAARGHQFHGVRDPLVVPMVNAILKGEKDKWRIARRGLFAACALLNVENARPPDSQSSVAA